MATAGKRFFNYAVFLFGTATPKLQKHVAKKHTGVGEQLITNILAPIEFVSTHGVSKKCPQD